MKSSDCYCTCNEIRICHCVYGDWSVAGGGRFLAQTFLRLATKHKCC